MVTIGNTVLPGVQTTVESSRSVGVGLGSPGDVLLIGGAEDENAVAEPNEGYQIRTPSRARHYFGDESSLTDAIIDALREGAFPVYAMAVEQTEISGEEFGTEVGTLDSAPILEDPEHVILSDPSEPTTVLGDPIFTYEDPENFVPETGEFYINPVTGKFHINSNATSLEVDYQHLDYESALDAVPADSAGDAADFIGVLAEHEDVIDKLVETTELMAMDYNFAIGVAGVDTKISDDAVGDYENSYDTSRLQLVYPSRNSDGESIIGSYLGLRSALGISASPMRKRLNSQNSLIHTLSPEQKTDLLDERVIPISNERAGSRIIEDVTTAKEDNSAEHQMRQGIARLVVDYVTLVVQANSDAFIGELHTASARNALQNIIKSELKDLMSLNAITAYSVSVQEVDSMTASVDVGVTTVAPLRNIVATVTAGEVDA